jgi:hypothetical protein
MVENYQDARWPRSAQGVMPLKVIAVLMPFTNVPFAYQSERQSQAPSKSDTPVAPAAVLSLPSRAAQRQAEPDRQLQVSSVVGRKVMSTRQMQGISPGMGNRLVIDGNGKSTKDR